MNGKVRVLMMVALAAAVAAGPGCRTRVPTATEVVATRVEALPAAPGDRAWDRTPEHVAKLILQDLVEPRLLTPSTGEVRVRALAAGGQVAFRLEWADASNDDTPGPSHMIDACAVQIPRVFDKEPPAPQMGDTAKAVDVTYWRADWQATMDGRGDTIRDLYPNASIDHYPFNAQTVEEGSAVQKEMALRYAPARALGNIRSGPRTSPVEDLTANGPGTLTPVASRGSDGKGVRSKTGWSVVITRTWPAGVKDGERTTVAFAVWQGAAHESGARKMRTGWIPLLIQVAR